MPPTRRALGILERTLEALEMRVLLVGQFRRTPAMLFRLPCG